MTAYATAADVRAMFEQDIPSTDDTRLTRWLDVASRALARAVPNLDARIASGAPASTTVRDVVVDAVCRRWRNPQGFASETAGDYSVSYGRVSDSSLDPSGWFTDAEVKSLRAGAGVTAAFRSIAVGTPLVDRSST